MTIVYCPGHGPTTGRCVLSDRPHLANQGVTVCEIKSWCPTEDDRLVKGKMIFESQVFPMKNIFKLCISFEIFNNIKETF